MLLSATLTFGQALPEKLQGSFNGRVYFDGSAFFKDKTHLGSGATISDIRKNTGEMARGILKVRGNFLNFYAVIAVPVYIGLDFFAKFDIVARKTFCTLFILQNLSVWIIWKVPVISVLSMPVV